ncbi:MAG: hypothetical protein AVDCRST_MAG56-4021 [uncultured Cytophagales bacterium]|uniref:Uncharacterized protein n=1 Tax=uncultured Cytophagales bacterium TaxID=158755 RepID=A0A6J4JNM1_9SPHI|nr:MAG: hypothetical protein AVDCRST_MAG56-4021 [uncultured Cytophagales bacterium]
MKKENVHRLDLGKETIARPGEQLRQVAGGANGDEPDACAGYTCGSSGAWCKPQTIVR